MVKKLESRMDVLNAFFPGIGEECTIKQVMNKVGLSYQPIYKYLDELGRRGLLRHEKKGNAHFYALNLQNEEVKKQIELMELKRRQEFLQKSEFGELLKRLVERVSTGLSPHLLSILLFGSVARGKHAKLSDIDVFIIVSSDDDAKTKTLMKEAENICVTVGYEFNRTVSPVTVPVSEFREMIGKRQQEFARNLLKDTIVLYGEGPYYDEVIRYMGELKKWT